MHSAPSPFYLVHPISVIGLPVPAPYSFFFPLFRSTLSCVGNEKGRLFYIKFHIHLCSVYLSWLSGHMTKFEWRKKKIKMPRENSSVISLLTTRNRQLLIIDSIPHGVSLINNRSTVICPWLWVHERRVCVCVCVCEGCGLGLHVDKVYKTTSALSNSFSVKGSTLEFDPGIFKNIPGADEEVFFPLLDGGTNTCRISHLNGH